MYFFYNALCYIKLLNIILINVFFDKEINQPSLNTFAVIAVDTTLIKNSVLQVFNQWLRVKIERNFQKLNRRR